MALISEEPKEDVRTTRLAVDSGLPGEEEEEEEEEKKEINLS